MVKNRPKVNIFHILCKKHTVKYTKMYIHGISLKFECLSPIYGKGDAFTPGVGPS